MHLERINGKFRVITIQVTRHKIVESIPEDPQVLKVVHDVLAGISLSLSRPLCITKVPLDARSTTVRLAESNIGDLAGDLMRAAYDTDVGRSICFNFCCILAKSTSC